MRKDPYLYDNSETLINLFKEYNDKKLREIEADYTSFRLRQLYENPIKGCFDFFHLCEVHKFIFQDLYSWAGEPRVINIEKEEPALGGISVEYTDFKNIKKETKDCCYEAILFLFFIYIYYSNFFININSSYNHNQSEALKFTG